MYITSSTTAYVHVAGKKATGIWLWYIINTPKSTLRVQDILLILVLFPSKLNIQINIFHDDRCKCSHNTTGKKT